MKKRNGSQKLLRNRYLVSEEQIRKRTEGCLKRYLFSSHSYMVGLGGSNFNMGHLLRSNLYFCKEQSNLE